MAKIKAVMRMKLIAIRVQKELPSDFFDTALAIPDIVPAKPTSKGISIPMPGLILTEAEISSLREQGIVFTLTSNGLRTTEFKVKARTARIRKQLPKKKERTGKYTKSGKYRRKLKQTPRISSEERAKGAPGESHIPDGRNPNFDTKVNPVLAAISQRCSVQLGSAGSSTAAGTPGTSGEMDGGDRESADEDRKRGVVEDEDVEEGDSEENSEGDEDIESDEDDEISGTDDEGENDFDSDLADEVDHARYFANPGGI
jgi:general transcription factor 3C polypeptide 5 (transcription factor C subunit 1)